MDTGPTRRTFLRLASVGVVGGLAGCSDAIEGPGSAGRRTPTLSPVPLPTVDADAVQVPPVGAVTGFGPLRLLVTAVERPTRARILGTELRSLGDDELLRVTTLFGNASDRYLDVAVDRYDVSHEGRFAESIEPFAGLTSSSFGGWAFAPGERRRVVLHYRLPPRTTDVELRGAMHIRSLPEESVAVATLSIDLTSVAASPGTLSGSITAPIHEVGARVDAGGIEVTLRAVESPVEVPNWTPESGFEYLAFDLSVTNDADPPAPVVVGLGRFGGMALADDAGNEFTERVWFDGTLAGGRYYEDSTALLPGETNEGTVAVAVPVEVVPLYLFWTPPAVQWQAGTGVRVNRFVWRVR